MSPLWIAVLLVAPQASISSGDVILPADRGVLVLHGQVVLPPYVVSGLGTLELHVNGVLYGEFDCQPNDELLLPDDPQAALEAAYQRFARGDHEWHGDSVVDRQIQRLALLSLHLSKDLLAARGSRGGALYLTESDTLAFRAALEAHRQCDGTPTGRQYVDRVLREVCACQSADDHAP